jgi:hypothetical protein
MPHDKPEITDLYDIVAPQVLAAMWAAHSALEKAGIRHALVGALAVGAYGYPRASKDVDFLLGDEAFQHHEAGLITLKPGVPIEYKGITIDPISIFPGCGHLHEAVASPLMSQGLPVVRPEALVYMKLVSPRKKDAADVIELLKAGLNRKRLTEYLRMHAPDLIPKLDALALEADGE